jgi:hypothetical protein
MCPDLEDLTDCPRILEQIETGRKLTLCVYLILFAGCITAIMFYELMTYF